MVAESIQPSIEYTVWLQGTGYVSTSATDAATKQERTESMDSRELAEAAVRRGLEILERLDRFGDTDPYEDGNILVFDKRFDVNSVTSRAYSYAFIRCNGGLWYGTGPLQVKAYTWGELVDFMSCGVEEVYEVTEMQQVY